MSPAYSRELGSLRAAFPPLCAGRGSKEAPRNARWRACDDYHLDSNQIEVAIPSHSAGSVDIVVTNRGGRSATVANRFTYFGAIPAPRINRVSVGSGSTEGGAPLVVSGHEFFPGTTLTIDGVLTPGRVGSEAEGWSGSFIEFTTPPHAPGRVEIVVTNPDGQSDRVPDGYEYVLPESLEFNGDWWSISGDWDWDLPETLRFKIQNSIVVSVACEGKELTYSPRPSVERGAFTVLLSGGGSLTGGSLVPVLRSAPKISPAVIQARGRPGCPRAQRPVRPLP